MSNPPRQPEGASRQAVGALIGALIGFGIAAKMIFADYETAGQLPWVQSVGITMIGGVVGLILASLFAGEEPPKEKADEANIESKTPERVDELHKAEPNGQGKIM